MRSPYLPESLRDPRGIFRYFSGNAGTGWYLVASLLPSLVTFALGPFILKRLGMEQYALLALAIYFFNMALAYTDFSTYTHLLVSYSRRDPDRMETFGNAMLLKAVLLGVALCIIVAAGSRWPREDGFYLLIGLYLLAIPFSTALADWYYVARRQYREFFRARTASAGVLVVGTLCWFLFGDGNIEWLPVITAVSGLAGIGTLVFQGGRRLAHAASVALRSASFVGAARLAWKLVPTASTVALSPYLLAYALPWYSAHETDSNALGAFSIAYRLVMGLVALAPALLYHVISLQGAGALHVRFFRLALLAGGVVVVLWGLGLPVLGLYFVASESGWEWFLQSVKGYSILMLGFFFICLRTPFVSACLLRKDYRAFFLIHLIGCGPILVLSRVLDESLSPSQIPWLACAPELLVTSMFLLWSRWIGRDGGKSVPPASPIVEAGDIGALDGTR